MDVLGLEDSPNGDRNVVYAEFPKQLKRSPEGWYETGFPWKGDHPPLPTNKSGSMRRLESLVKRLKKAGKLDDYDAIIKEQLQEGIIEEAPLAATGQEFYIPHKAVVRESAENRKVRIVHDASAKAHDSVPSLNDCLEVGPPLKTQLWKVLLRGKFHAFALTGDIRETFLQVRISAQDGQGRSFTNSHVQALGSSLARDPRLSSLGEWSNSTLTIVELTTLSVWMRSNANYV